MDPIYFAHGYRKDEAALAGYFGSRMSRTGFLPSLDPPSEDVNAAKLEKHLGYTLGLIAVLSPRPSGPSQHILFEIGMCLRARKPLLAFLDDRLPGDLLPRQVLQRRFSARSYARETREHMQALNIFRTYVGQQPAPKYHPLVEQRYCVLVGFGSLDGALTAAIRQLITAKGYRITELPQDEHSIILQGRAHFEVSGASLAVCVIDDASPRSNYLLGAVQAALVPTISLTTKKDSPLRSDVPQEYQRRFIPTSNPEEALKTVERQIDLYEEDFIELDNEGQAEGYASLLAASSSESGQYSHGVRTYIAQEVVIMGDQVMRDKYEAGQVGAQGPGAHAHDMTFNQVWNQSGNTIDLPKLAEELGVLRSHLRAEAKTPEHDVAIGAVANAEIAAKQNNGPKALEWLATAGRWTLDVAVKFGAELAVAALKAALHL